MRLQQTKLHARWRRFTNSDAEQRFAVLHPREVLQAQLLSDTRREKPGSWRAHSGGCGGRKGENEDEESAGIYRVPYRYTREGRRT
jgi:hypothetical protein